ncbi:MAG: hypothetical protein BWY04_00386 [candidate division CPR1 bacterium ADurb.Bin160]|uniref:Uncharacterized protein n=1 Tax=candidate division CPR1 bacterium ADurb.Bin160 TaxID=1852826 RepID=A0A1V5ZPJ1_9BACT|nr:MAG: hypothetical protein BWY04_00386 [candidate division CPR1 bacterium ADurb.Bin160]
MCFCAISRPYSSCHGVILTTQVHSKETTLSSHMIGMFLFIIGIITFCHINFLYLLSCGFTATATSAKIVLRFFVGTLIETHLDSIKYLITNSFFFFFLINRLVFNTFVCNSLLRETTFFSK